MRRFELVDGTSSKFWEIAVSGKVLTTRWGRIGAAGSAKQQTLAIIHHWFAGGFVRQFGDQRDDEGDPDNRYASAYE